MTCCEFIEILVRSSQLFLAQANKYRIEIWIGIFTALLVQLVLNWIRNRKRNFPPGPRGLPIVGYLPWMTKNTHLDFTKLGNKYGKVFSVRLGAEELVVLHDVEAVKEGLVKLEIQGRPLNGFLSNLIKDSAFFVKDNPEWWEQRKFVVHSMKDLGLGRSKIEQDILDEIDSFLRILTDSKEEPISLKEPFLHSLSNNISSLVFGKRFDFDDPDRRTLGKSLETVSNNISQTAVITFFPWLRYVPFYRWLTPLESILQDAGKVQRICEREIDAHQKKFDPTSVGDFIDSYLLEMETRKEKDPCSSFKYKTLVANVIDLFYAGTDTALTIILWCIYIIASFPDVQKKVQREIQDVIGCQKRPEYLDHKKMPYTQAVILEILRWRTLLPLGVTRRVTEDTKLCGYDIPKGTAVIPNLWHVHHDPKLWKEPDTFMPERFLSSDGRAVLKSNNFMVFSLGKRSCPGETMANMEIFLYFTSILQKFDVVIPQGEIPDLEGNVNIVYSSKHFKVKFTPKSVR